MNVNMRILPTAILTIALMSLAACGGGGGGGGGGSSSGPEYSGSTSAASIDDATTAEETARAAGEGSRQAQAQASAPVFTGVGIAGPPRDVVTEITLDVMEKSAANDHVAGASSSQDGSCGGTAVVKTTTYGSGTLRRGTVTFNNYCTNDSGNQITLDGSVELTITLDGGGNITGLEFSFNNVKVTWDGTTQRLNMDVSCNDLTDCTFTEDFKGIDGRVYRLTNVTVTGTATSGFEISARVYDPDHGYVDITTNTPVTFNCSNQRPGSGEITFTDGSANTVVVTFDSCSSFTVTYNMSASSVSW